MEQLNILSQPATISLSLALSFIFIIVGIYYSKKYLKLSKEHHPDILISKGVPQEVIEESKKKMRAINSAWDQIQKLKTN